MAQTVAALPTKTVINGYRVEHPLGQGGFGITYLATRLSDKQQVVLKENIPGTAALREPGRLNFVIPPGEDSAAVKGGEAWARNNFLNETMCLQRLSHPGVIAVLDAFSSSQTNTEYYVMPYIQGGLLSTLAAKPGERSPEWVMYIAASLINSLSYVHDMGLYHRDMKPENVMLKANGEPVLIDFGAAREAHKANKTAVVTPDYAPVEQSTGGSEGAWTDIYALGGTLHYVITGEAPLGAKIREGRAEDPYVPLSSREDLVQLYGYEFLSSVDKALSLDAAKRFPTLAHWKAALHGLPGFQAITPVLRFPRQSAAAAVAGAVGAAGVVGAMAAGTAMANSNKKKLVGMILAALMLLLALMLALILMRCQETPAPPAAEPPPVVVPLPPEPKPQPEPEPKPVIKSKPDFRLIGRTGAKLYSLDGTKVIDNNLPPFRVYYAASCSAEATIGEQKEPGYKVWLHPDGEPVGAMREADLHPWPLNLTMRFTSAPERDRGLFFDTQESAAQYMLKAPEERKSLLNIMASGGSKTSDADSFEQSRQKLTDAGILGIEPRKKGTYLMPVLDFAKDNDGAPANYKYEGSDAKNQVGLVKVATMTSKLKTEVTKVTPPTVNVVFVVDTTSSMSHYLDEIRARISQEAEKAAAQGAEKKLNILFGLVGYRDWKSQSEDGSAANPETGADNKDAAFTEKMGYIVNNYTKDRLLPIDEFRALLNEKLADGEYAISCSGEDSIDFREEVYGAVLSAIDETPWSDYDKTWNEKTKKDFRFIWLVGDAGGREVGEREDDSLRLHISNDKDWNYRAEGSIAGMNVRDLLRSKLEAKCVRLRSVFVLTSPLKYSTRKALTMDTWWEQSQQPGIDQFMELSKLNGAVNCDVLLPPQANPKRMEMTQDYLDMVAEYATNVGARYTDESFTRLLLADFDDLIRFSNEAANFTEDTRVLEGESAIGRMFASSYVEWRDSLAPDPENRNDAVGWTQDRGVKATDDTLKPCIVLSSKQLDAMIQSLDSVLKELSGDQTEMAASEADSVFEEEVQAPNFTENVVNLYTGVHMDGNGRQADDQVSEGLQKKIHLLPYRSPLLTKYAAGATIDRVRLVKDLNSTLTALKNIFRDREQNSWWMLDPGGNKDFDYVIIPMDALL